MERKSATPSRVKGQCKLCGKAAYLCNSHLMPAALYRLLRSTTVTPRDPLIVTPRATFTTSREVSAHLLCVDCEDRFRVHGEDWVLRQCYRIGEGFKLRDSVLKGKLLDEGPVAKIYSTTSNPDIEANILTYFGASIISRAAVHPWSLPGLPLDLGPYLELLRKYLLGEEQFPHAAAIHVWVSNYDKPSRCLTSPHSTRIWGCHAHSFDIPGMRFDLLIGRSLPSHVRLLCLLNGPDCPILVSNAPDDILATDMAKASMTTKLSKTLQKMGKGSWGL
jgi:hypothetical protein